MARPSPDENLSAWLDGELDAAERAEVDAWLASDPSARAEVEQIEHVATFLREAGPVRAPQGFHARVMQRVESEAAPGGWWAWLRRPFGLPIEGLAVAAVAALVLLVALPVTFTATVGGYERGADVASSSGEWSAPAAPAPEGAKQAGQVAEPADDAVADVGELGGTSADDEFSTVRLAPSDKPVPTGARTKEPGKEELLQVIRGGGAAEPTTEPVAKPTTSSVAPAPALHGALTYEVRAYEVDAASTLQQIANGHGGRVEDTAGRRVSASDLKDGEPHTYVVYLPAEALADFGDDLRSVGAVSEGMADGLQPGPMIKVRVTLTFAPPEYRQADEAQEYAPAPTSAPPAH